jgi:uncharacterized damage-inducible protein DinB
MTKELFSHQYQLVQASRKVMLDFCESFREDDFIKGVTFDGKSIGQLLVHVANTYQGWIITVARKGNVERFKESNYTTVQSVRKLFEEVDTIATDFIRDSKNNWLEEITAEIRKQNRVLTKAAIFTHVITHEFHHKGQILMLARGMGYVPPDTDVIRV